MPPTDTIAHPEVVVMDLYSPPLCPLQDAWWWHTPWWWHGGSSSSRDRLRGNHIDLRQCLNPPASSCPWNFSSRFWCPSSWRTKETRWCMAISTPTILPGSLEHEMTGQQPEERPSRGDQQFATCCKPSSPYSPLPGPSLLTRYHPIEQASPPWFGMDPPLTPLGLTTSL